MNTATDFGQCPCGMQGAWNQQPWTTTRARAAMITDPNGTTHWATWTWDDDDGMAGTCHGDSQDGTHMIMHRAANQDSHISAHTPGTPWADDSTFCGIDSAGMRRQTSFFRGWFGTICPTCGNAMDHFS